MTHDSIGLGEDGPTHQPVEHLAALRVIPGLLTFRPADAVESAECWLAALQAKQPSVLALSRQNLPPVRTTHVVENLCAKGGYILKDAEGPRRATIFATGSEVMIALAAREQLQASGVGTAVVSMPCWELFDAQDDSYKSKVIGRDTVRVAVEAASLFGWERYVGEHGAVVGMTTFGASAPAEELYKHFGITAEAVTQKVRERLK
jgi:transketolase